MAGSPKIKVFVNGRKIETFRGMRVKHILPHETVEAVRQGTAMVMDEEGHERGLEGSLNDGDRLRVHQASKKP